MLSRSILDCRRPFHTSTRASQPVNRASVITLPYVSPGLPYHPRTYCTPVACTGFCSSPCTGMSLSLSLYHHPANPPSRVPWDSSLSGRILCSIDHEAIRFLYPHRSSLALFRTYVRHSHPRNANVNRPIPILGIYPRSPLPHLIYAQPYRSKMHTSFQLVRYLVPVLARENDDVNPYRLDQHCLRAASTDLSTPRCREPYGGAAPHRDSKCKASGITGAGFVEGLGPSASPLIHQLIGLR